MPKWNKCIICGRFIPYKDIGTEKIGCNFTPDSHFTYESIEYYHTICQLKETDNYESFRKLINNLPV